MRLGSQPEQNIDPSDCPHSPVKNEGIGNRAASDTGGGRAEVFDNSLSSRDYHEFAALRNPPKSAAEEQHIIVVVFSQ